MPILFLIFVMVPLLEIYLLIEIGSLIGAVWTVTGVVGTAALGAALVRRQGLAALSRFRSATQAGELPAVTIIEGLALLLAGALLLTPGFFTDFVGFLLLTPPLRQFLVKRWLIDRIVAPAENTSNRKTPGAVDGEFRRIDD
ncbi:MAG TPA: exlusion protein FxsA [Gammaproteobacteria bacterium]|nr:exlusion protein FxsA [Gammaproteobacteria bacterium]